MKITLLKSISNYTLLLIASGLLAGCAVFKPAVKESNLIGTWISESDSNWKLVFTREKCTQYYSGSIIENDSYTTSNSSPQCGETVPVNRYTRYLKLTNLEDTAEVICYEINGVSDKTLSLSMIGRGGQLVFTRQ